MINITPTGFVELNRTFSDFQEDVASEQAAFDSYFSDFIGGGMTWEKVLRHRCVVILAEAGSGKTWELKAQAQKLRDDGQSAFFVRLEGLAQRPLAECLAEDERVLLERWLESSQEATFFLDAVDEAKLSTRHAFEQALHSFSDGISTSARKRLKTVVSSRIVGWKNLADTSLLRNLMDLPDKVTILFDDGAPENIDPLRVVTLNALGNGQIQTLSNNFIPTQASAFFQALDDHDAWSFARRPQDVERLAYYWRDVGDLGGLTELLEFDIHSRLQETDEDRLRDSELSEIQLRSGAEALAAAVVFGKTLSILIEGTTAEDGLANCVLPSKELSDWTPAQLADLLSRALFDPAAFSKVRFHHRSAADYLAAQWLEKLLVNDLPVSDAINLFFVRSSGQEVLIPSRAAVACWLACGDQIWNQRLRNKLLEVAPDALLSRGDGRRLDVEIRAELLTNVVSTAGAEGQIRGDASNDQLKRLASPELSALINALLLDPNTTDDGCILLLQMVREGKIVGCVSGALDLARNPNTSSSVLIYACTAIASAGSEDEKDSLISELLTHANLSSRVSYILVTHYYPYNLTGEQLIEVCRLTNRLERMVAPDFSNAASKAIVERAPENHVASLLDGFIGLLEQRPGITIENRNTSFLVSRQNIWLAPVLRATVTRALEMTDINEGMIDRIIDALVLIEMAEDIERHYESRKKDVHELSLSHPDVRRAFCWRKVQFKALQKPETKVSIHGIFRHYALLDVDKHDIDWLYEDLHQRNPLEHRQHALHLANDYWWYCRLGRETRAKIRHLIADDTTLKRQFKKDFPNPLTLWVSRTRDRIDKYIRWGHESDLHKMKAVHRRCLNFYRLWRTSKDIASGNNFNNLWHLYHTHPGTEEDSKRHTPDAVERKYGKRIAKVYREGCKSLWKQWTPERSDHHNFYGRVSIGLLGLQFDLEDGLDLSALTQDDALRATRYAVEALNVFPSWLSELAELHPHTTRDIIRECVIADWPLVEQSARGNGVGQKLYHASPSLMRLMAADLFALIINGDPGSSGLLMSAVGVVLRGSPDTERDITSVARDRMLAGGPAHPHAIQWFIIWLWLDAGSALDWLEELSATQPEAEVDSFILGIGDIMEHDSLHVKPKEGTPAYHTPSTLSHLTILLYRHLRPEDDIERPSGITYSPGQRDHAQDFRNAIITRLDKTPGVVAHSALVELAEAPELAEHRSYLLRGAASRRLLDSEPDVWRPGDAADLSKTHDPTPRSAHGLFAIALRRLDILRDDLGDADFRKREGLPTEGDEDRLQEWLARYLEEKSHGKYEALREIMVGFGKMPDLRFVAPPHTPTSIEVKWADDWSFNELCEALSNQLVGRYMRARRSRHGVLLLCWRGKKQHWKPTGKNGVTFTELAEHLNNQADVILDGRWDIDGLTVIGLNFSGGPIDGG